MKTTYFTNKNPLTFNMKPIILTSKQIRALRDKALAEQRRKFAPKTRVEKSKKIFNRKELVRAIMQDYGSHGIGDGYVPMRCHTDGHGDGDFDE